LLKTVTAIFESKGRVLLLDERNATLRMIKGTLNDPGLQKDFVKLLDIPPGSVDSSLAQTALALRYTSKYIELLADTLSSDTTESAGDNSAGVIKINSNAAKDALVAVQEDKAAILVNPSEEIFLPVEYRSTVDIREGASQPLDPINPIMRPTLEKDLAKLQFTSNGGDKWEKWRSYSHSTLRLDLAPLELAFEGKKVTSLEEIQLDRPNGKKFMLKISMYEGETYFSSSKLSNSDFISRTCSYLSGLQMECDNTAQDVSVKPDDYWTKKDTDWHLDVAHRWHYQSIIHPMMTDYTTSVCDSLIKNKRETISIVDIGGGSGNLAEMIFKKIKEQYPQLAVVYRLVDLSPADIKTAKERFERLNYKNWDVQALTKNIFSYRFDAERALRDMNITEKADIILSSGGPLSPSVGGTLEQALQLNQMCANMLEEGGYLLLAGLSGVWPNRSHHEQNNMTVKNTYDVENDQEMYVVQKSNIS
jgi:SAM-dependent methyltransferase